MTMRIATMEVVLQIATRRVPNRTVAFGHPAPDLAIVAATLISAASLLTGLAQIAGMPV